MNALLILLPVSLILVGVALWSFFWAVDNAQFDDLDGPGMMAIDAAPAGPGAPDEQVLPLDEPFGKGPGDRAQGPEVP